MKGPIYLLIYAALVGWVLNAIGWRQENKSAVVTVILLAFVGWFVVIAMITKGERSNSGIEISKDATKEGFKFLGTWILCMFVLIVMAVIVWLFSESD